MHKVFLEPSSRCPVLALLDDLFMAVLVQISCSLEGSQKGCCCSDTGSRKAKHLCALRCSCPSSPCSLPGPGAGAPRVTGLCSACRTAISTMQALFGCLGGASLVEDMGRQGAWDMLESAETYPSGVTVLTR